MAACEFEGQSDLAPKSGAKLCWVVAGSPGARMWSQILGPGLMGGGAIGGRDVDGVKLWPKIWAIIELSGAQKAGLADGIEPPPSSSWSSEGPEVR